MLTSSQAVLLKFFKSWDYEKWGDSNELDLRLDVSVSQELYRWFAIMPRFPNITTSYIAFFMLLYMFRPTCFMLSNFSI